MTRGLNIIKDMSREEIVDELLDHQRSGFMKMEIDNLKHMLVMMRTDEYRARLHKEAGIEPQPPYPSLGVE